MLLFVIIYDVYVYRSRFGSNRAQAFAAAIAMEPPKRGLLVPPLHKARPTGPTVVPPLYKARPTCPTVVPPRALAPCPPKCKPPPHLLAARPQQPKMRPPDHIMEKHGKKGSKRMGIRLEE